MRSSNISPQEPDTALSERCEGRADISRWQCWDLAHWGAQACQPLTFENLVKKFVNLGAPDPAAVAKAPRPSTRKPRCWTRIWRRHKYLVNDTLTIADFTVAAPLFHAQGAGMPVGPYANVGAWFDRVSSLPCWSETAPQMPAAA